MAISKKSIPMLFLLLSIFVSPLRCYGFIIAGLNFSLFRIFGLLMIITYIFNQKIILDNISKLIGILAFISLFQGVYSPYLSGSYSNYFSLCFGLIWVFFAYQVLKKNNNMVLIEKTILLSAIFPIGLGLYQWFIYRSTGSIPALPFQFMVSSEGKTGLTYNVYARITSCFGDPAYMTTYFVGVFSIALQRIITYSKKESKISFMLTLSDLVLIVLETVMSISLSGLIGIAASFVLIMFLNFRNSKNIKTLLVFSIIIITGFIIFFENSGSELIEILIFKSNSQNQTSTNLFGRSEYIFNALNVWLNHPFFGAGFGGLRLNGSFSSAHSSLLTVLGQQGLIVFFLHLFMLIFYPISFLKGIAKRNNQQYLAHYTGLLISLLSILVLTLGYDTLYSLDFCYVIIAIVLSFGKKGVEGDESSLRCDVYIQRRKVC